MRDLVVVLLCTLSLLGAQQAIADPSAPEGRLERRFELFSGVTTSTPPSATRAVTTGKEPTTARAGSRYQPLYSGWAKANEIDPLTAASNDRVVIAVNAGESFEVVLSRVNESPDGLNTFWTGKVVNDPYSHVFITFIRPPGKPNATLDSGSLNAPSLQRVFIFQTEEERPGWVLVSEVKPEPSDLSHDIRDSDRSETKPAQGKAPQKPNE